MPAIDRSLERLQVPIFTVVMAGYAIAGMIFFGIDNAAWSDPGTAIFNVWAMNFGLYGAIFDRFSIEFSLVSIEFSPFDDCRHPPAPGC